MHRVVLPPVTVNLPDSPLVMWDRGDLHDFLHLSADIRVEILDGQVVASTVPHFWQNDIKEHIHEAFFAAALTEGEQGWTCRAGNGLVLAELGCGFIPDLLVFDREIHRSMVAARVRRPSSDEIEMCVEVTSPGNAAIDRGGQPKGKWASYAKVEIPYYLLVDRDPKIAKATLYSVPDAKTGAYLHQEEWEFGQTIVLPTQFGVSIPTSGWLTWSDG
ncbi:Uma2 family endonuclease [Nonomuraea soli]|uniref:Uma2 family endonuclease n=1 Tax=Nonomuraea soli TaxID=1032476 RepID=A0A7W0HU61_9ACTN|nr:Uma2 family endonuclease [Nonomuraea soli]MBA2895750.1 Uma2 family endonuclease [Nonomuraea soli]